MWRRVVTFAALAIGLCLLGLSAVSAAAVRSGESVSLAQSEVVDSSMYAGASAVSIAGTVKGDLYCAGQTVEITGNIEGDVLCAAQQIRISGSVTGDIRLAAQVVSIDGSIAGSGTVFAQTFEQTSRSRIDRDLTIYGQTLNLRGQTGRDILGAAQTVTVSGTVGRSVELETERLTVTSGGRVGGDLIYTSRNKANVESGATIVGTTQQKTPTQKTEETQAAKVAAAPLAAIYNFFAMMVLGVAIILGTPSLMHRTLDTTKNRLWPSLGIGLIVLFVPPIIALLLTFTFIGIPLAAFVILLWLATLLLSTPIAAHAIGRLVFGKIDLKVGEKWQQVIGLAVGLLLIEIVGLIPILGGLVKFVALLLGLGTFALVMVMRNKIKTKESKA